jgi:hypothetical protein
MFSDVVFNNRLFCFRVYRVSPPATFLALPIDLPIQITTDLTAAMRQVAPKIFDDFRYHGLLASSLRRATDNASRAIVFSNRLWIFDSVG